MESSTQGLQRINELIYDEEKIVTSSILAGDLKVSLDDAKNLLDTFMKNHKPKPQLEDVHVTYLLCGSLQGGKGLAIYLVKDEDLKDKKSLFDNISAEIVYSIQKGKQIDFNMIALTNSTYENSTGCLINKNYIKRNIKSKILPTTQSAPSTTTQSKMSSKMSNFVKSGKANVEENSKDHLHSSQKQPKAKKNGGIASFFSKAPVKSQNGANLEVLKSEKAEENGDTSTAKDFLPKNEQKEVTKEIAIDEKIEVDNQDQKPRNRNVDDQTNTKKRKKETKKNGPNKKRKRIQEICDSDSSDIFEDDKSEDVIEMSDDEPVPVPVVQPDPVPKNKKRKAVDKTYMDEEGFIVTTTEYIYESASDEDKGTSKTKPEEKQKILLEKKNEKVKQETKPPASKGKTNKKPSSGKQPTLMSFFKKA